ncbi:MAG: hypothetical protein ACPGVB_04515 [Chitinophagales bacterium]
MRYLAILLLSMFLFACSSDGEKVKESSSSQKRAEFLDKINERTEETQPKKSANTLTELLDQIWELPKVKQRSEYVRTETKGERKLKLKIQQKPTQEDPYYWVKVGEDNGLNFVSHFLFALDPNTSEIFYYDGLTGEKITVEEWEKMEEESSE